MQLEKLLGNTKNAFFDQKAQKKYVKQTSFSAMDNLVHKIFNSKSFHKKIDAKLQAFKLDLINEIAIELQTQILQATRTSEELERLKTSKQAKKNLKKNCTVQNIVQKKGRKTHKNNKKKDVSQKPQKINFSKIKQKLKLDSHSRLKTAKNHQKKHIKKNTTNLKISQGKDCDQLSLNLKSKKKLYIDMQNQNSYFDLTKQQNLSYSEVDKIESESADGESEYYDVNVGYSSSNQASQSHRAREKSFMFEDFQNENASNTTNPFKREFSQNLSNSEKNEKFSFKIDEKLNSAETQKKTNQKRGSIFERRESFSPAGGVIFHFTKVPQ